ncbi:hypothetical protein FNV43_RR17073 [Rhamnella rubrinervis]|uniref:Uncharacterized protein n=1 Tax=Rhamnella rubrinervis TaxID=2594499 RepID=A0A8K0ME98_9ROSA|nr:hypothetical protein FNV43_RR17073 [Rhamnella rubrinervis]
MASLVLLLSELVHPQQYSDVLSSSSSSSVSSFSCCSSVASSPGAKKQRNVESNKYNDGSEKKWMMVEDPKESMFIAAKLQASLQNLTLVDREEEASQITEKILADKEEQYGKDADEDTARDLISSSPTIEGLSLTLNRQSSGANLEDALLQQLLANGPDDLTKHSIY